MEEQNNWEVNEEVVGLGEGGVGAQRFWEFVCQTWMDWSAKHSKSEKPAFPVLRNEGNFSNVFKNVSAGKIGVTRSHSLVRLLSLPHTHTHNSIKFNLFYWTHHSVLFELLDIKNKYGKLRSRGPIRAVRSK